MAQGATAAVEHDPLAGCLQPADQVGIVGGGDAGRQTAGENETAAVGEQRLDRPFDVGQVFVAGEAAGKIDLGHLRHVAADDLDVAPGAAREARTGVTDSLAREQAFKDVGIVAAEQPGDGDGDAEIGQAGGYIHRLAAGVHLLPVHAIQRSGGEAGDADVVIDGRTQADGGD